MLLMPLGAWAVDYPIVVAGVQVTDANAGNVLGDGETATVVFTPAGDAPATLTLNGATLYGSIVLQSGLDDLTIHLLGENKIQGTDYQNPLANGIKRENGATTGTLTFTTASGASGTLFFPNVTTPIEGFNDIVYNNGLEWGCDSYVEDNKVCTNFYQGVGTNVVLASASWQDCITKSQTMLSLNNGATITFREDDSLGRVLTLSGFTDYISSICWYSPDDVKIEISGTNSIKYTAGNYRFIGNSQSNISFIKTGTSATLRLYGKGNDMSVLNTPYISGFKNSDNPTIGEGLYVVDVKETRKDPIDNISKDFFDHYITTEAYGLTVKGVRVHHLDGVYKGHKDHILGEDDATVKFTPADNTAQTPVPATLTLNGANIEHALSNAIVSDLTTPLYVHLNGTNSIWSGSYLPFEGATGDDADLVFTTTTDAAPGSLTMTSSHAGFGKTTFYTGFNEVQYPENSGSLGAKEESGNVIISQIQSYGLSIAGIPVTSENAEGITGDGITGTVTYNADQGALTLDGATIAGNILVTSGSALTIKVKGENTINAGEYSALKSETATNAVTLAFVKEGSGDCSLQLNSTGVTAISTGFNEPTYTNLALVVDGLSEELNPTYYTLYGLAYYAGNNTYEPITSATITSYTTYDLIISGEQVTNLNLNAICKGTVGAGHITFDGEHTLTLNKVPSMVFNGSYPFIQTSMDLTINIVGNSYFDCGNSTFIASGDNNTHTVTFTTDADDPGMLSLTVGDQFVGFTKAFENGLSWKPSYYYKTNAPAAWVAIPLLSVGGVEVTETNATDVLGNGTVSFEVNAQTETPTYTLTLNGATLTKPVKVGLANLTIDIQGTNSITTEERCIQKTANTTPAVTFTSTSDVVGSLTLNGADGVNSVGEYNKGSFSISDKLALVLKKDGYLYSNQYWFTDGSTKEAKLSPYYGVTVGGMQICPDNAADVIGEGIGDGDDSGMVSFDKDNSILTLNNASLSGVIRSSLPNLTIELVGNNSIYSGGDRILQAGVAANMTIQSSADVKGRLSMHKGYSLSEKGNFVDNNVTLAIIAPLAVISGSLEDNTASNDYYATIGEAYNLWVGDTQVSLANAGDILAEVWGPDHEGTMTFDAENNILTISEVGELPFGIASGLDALTIKVSGENKMYSEGGAATISYTGNGTGTLTLVKDAETTVCSLDLRIYAENLSAISGFSSLSYEGFYVHSDASGVAYDTENQTLNDSEGNPVDAVKFSTVETYYNLWYNDGEEDIQVTNLNKNDITGKKNTEGEPQVTFSYDPESKRNILTLNGATLEGTFTTTISPLYINLIGTNDATETEDETFLTYNGQSADAKVIFMTTSDSPTTLRYEAMQGVTASYENGLALIQTPTDTQPAIVGNSYGIAIQTATATINITALNRENVLNDGNKTVQFDGRNTLILNGANIEGGIVVGATNNLNTTDGLIVHLTGNNTITNGTYAITNEGSSKPLTLTTSDVEQGKLVYKCTTCTLTVANSAFSGFAPIKYKDNLAASLEKQTSQDIVTIVAVMEPFVTSSGETNEQKGDSGDGLGEDIKEAITGLSDVAATTLLGDGVIINKILYTLPGEADGYMVEDGKMAVALNTPMDDDDDYDDDDIYNVNKILKDIMNGTIQPGTELGAPHTFAERFHGMSFLLPAGYGEISLDVNTNEAGILHVKVGSNEPVAITGTTGFETIKIPYSLTEESYVFIYRYAPSTPLSRGDDGHRAPGRKETTTTGIRGLSVNANSVESSPEPPVSPKLLDKSLLKQDRNHIYIETEDAVDVEGIESDAFANLTGDITYIDLSNTAIKDILVDRKHSGSPFKDIPEKTFIYLPAGNTIAPSAPGQENKNVVIGSVCDDMELEMDESGAPFEAAKDFVAVKATQKRDYSPMLNKSCTVYLPFAINKETAANLGTFYELAGIATDQVTFESVKETKANTPYLFKPKTPTLSAEMAEVKKDIPVPDPIGVKATFEGTYSKKNICSDGETQYYCFLGESAGANAGKFVHVETQSVTVNPFRGYIKVTGTSLGRSLEINTGDDDVTAIKNIKVGTEDNVYYDLQGRRVLYPKKGIYIVNGKKVILK